MAKGDFAKQFKESLKKTFSKASFKEGFTLKRVFAAAVAGVVFGAVSAIATHVAGPAAAVGIMATLGGASTAVLWPVHKKNLPPQNPLAPPAPEAPKA